jgi:hypothetical protein
MEDQTKPHFHSHPWVGGNKERAGGNILSVREDNLVI